MSTSTAVATGQKRSVLFDVASKYGMEEVDFEATVRQQCSPAGRDARPLTNEEFLALILVSNEYNLNPITREIYAFPKRGGGIVPIVSVDGWVSLVNSHKAFDGVEFSVENDANGRLLSTTCRIFRKDRSKPIEVTEYLAECYRETEPWKMKHRMLRHKAFIQCARYAFGFSGIYDEDEGERIINAENVRDITPPPPPPAPPSDASPPAAGKPPKEENAGEATKFNLSAALEVFHGEMRAAASSAEVKAVWSRHSKILWPHLPDAEKAKLQADAAKLRDEFLAREKEPEAATFSLAAFVADLKSRAAPLTDLEPLEALWSEVERANESGLISGSDVERIGAEIFDPHRARIDEIFPMDR